MKVNNLENNVMSYEINGNHFEQYGRRNNLEITGMPYDVSDENLEEKVIQVLSEIEFNVSSSDMGPSINYVSTWKAGGISINDVPC